MNAGQLGTSLLRGCAGTQTIDKREFEGVTTLGAKPRMDARTPVFFEDGRTHARVFRILGRRCRSRATACTTSNGN